MGDRKGRPYGAIEAVLDFDMGGRAPSGRDRVAPT